MLEEYRRSIVDISFFLPIQVCHFIGEMVKFGLFGKGEALFCLKMLLFDFSHHNIEMACALMEACGRFLYRSKESHQRTKIYLVSEGSLLVRAT